MDVKLKVLEGKNAGQEIPVTAKKFFIGRAEDCHLRPGSDLISRHHCVLLVEDTYTGVRDFGSKNGTFVNDERVIGERELKPGDRLTIGPLRFEIHVAHGLAAKKKPPVADIKEAAARTASNAASHDTMDDVDQWLAGDSDETQSSTGPRETQTTSMGDTDSIHLSNTQTLVPDPVEDETKSGHGKKPTGKLPPVASKDSQEAAAAMLSKLRKRR